ncbi:MAG TPA: 16S rRNA (cytosine(1402)-N(4))-methyltransferase RsmH [Candidatus Paceibacterota bacterium]|nr:16S rRNA (cytosine(1402)-N(4))-methyltransferase RsmH [Candidatus Paceibacterota bacterium]
MTQSERKHIPVLLNDVITYLDPKPGAFIVDGTLDGGGHAEAILERLGPTGKFLGVDLDPEMVERFTEGHGSANVKAVHSNYADLPAVLEREHLPLADGLLLDLGFSSEHLEQSGRGFSFLRDEPLRMTYDPQAKSVAELLRRIRQDELARIIREYGGERWADRVAKAIKIRSQRRPITTTGDLRDIVRGALPKYYERGRIDPATRTFQALRIYANDELGNLEKMLSALPGLLAPGGRVVIVSFHSLEDRLVKEAFRTGAQTGWLELLTKKPIEADYGEVRRNPRSRSAKLRAARKIS